MDYMRNTKALIFDIRHNAGGGVTKAAGRFVTNEKKIPMYDKYGYADTMRIVPQGSYIYINPVVILINGCSVSAAEYISSVLQPLDNIILAGDTTAGMGGEDFQTELSSGKKVTTARSYSLYKNNLIQWNGIPPDTLIQNTEAEVRQNTDRQLEFALKYLRSKI